MEQISKYLQKFKNLLKNEYAVREVIFEALYEVTGAKLDKSRISVRGKTAHIKASPATKNEVVVRKKALLDKLHEKGVTHITDIK